jgi:hypothetical protein
MSDVAGYRIRDKYYCQDCVPDSEAPVIWEDHDLDRPAWCEVCGALLLSSLSLKGQIHILERARDYLVARVGNKKDLHALCHEYMSTFELGSVQGEIMHLCFWATSEVKALEADPTLLTNIIDKEV